MAARPAVLAGVDLAYEPESLQSIDATASASPGLPGLHSIDANGPERGAYEDQIPSNAPLLAVVQLCVCGVL